MMMDDELLTVACMPGLSHGSFRLYAILRGVEEQLVRATQDQVVKGSRGNYFPVTLSGLRRLHPGTAKKVAGYTTLIKQVAELRAFDLLETRAAMPRNEPDLPVLVKLLRPKKPHAWISADGNSVKVADVHRLVELQ